MSKWEIVIDGCGGLFFNYRDQAEAYADSFLGGTNFVLREIQILETFDV
jgi:hypothetical protein